MRTWRQVDERHWEMEETPFQVRYNPERERVLCFEVWQDDELKGVAASLDGAKLEAKRQYEELVNTGLL